MAAKTDIFTGIGYTIDNLLTDIQQISLNDKMQQLQLLVSGLITLTIMYKGYMVLAGKSQDPIRELVWDLGRKAFILTFAMGAGMWLQYSIEAVKGIYEWAGGGIGFYQQLDKLIDSAIDYTEKMWDISGFFDKFFAALMVIIIGICLCAIIFELFFAIIASGVSNAFLIVVLPLALFCLMWNQTKQVFTQWCQLLLSNTFTILFLSIFLTFCQSVLMTLFNPNTLEKGLSNIIIHVLEAILMCFVLVQITKVIKSLAQNLAQVSLDSAMSGVGASQMLGAAGGKAAKVAGNFASGALGAKKGLAHAAGGLAASAAGGLAGLAAKGGLMVGKAILSKMRG